MGAGEFLGGWTGPRTLKAFSSEAQGWRPVGANPGFDSRVPAVSSERVLQEGPLQATVLGSTRHLDEPFQAPARRRHRTPGLATRSAEYAAIAAGSVTAGSRWLSAAIPPVCASRGVFDLGEVAGTRIAEPSAIPPGSSAFPVTPPASIVAISTVVFPSIHMLTVHNRLVATKRHQTFARISFTRVSAVRAATSGSSIYGYNSTVTQPS